jgi:hypothetical protein
MRAISGKRPTARWKANRPPPGQLNLTDRVGEPFRTESTMLAPVRKPRGPRVLLPWVAAAWMVLALGSVVRAEQPDYKIGDFYRLQITRPGFVISQRGTLVVASKHWLVLVAVEDARQYKGVPYLKDIPLVGRLFRRDTVVHGAEVVHWIPREAASVESHEPADPTAKPIPPDEVEQLDQLLCSVLTIERGTPVQHTGVLSESPDGQLKLIAQDGSDGPGEKIERQSIVCIFSGTRRAKAAAAKASR